MQYTIKYLNGTIIHANAADHHVLHREYQFDLNYLGLKSNGLPTTVHWVRSQDSKRSTATDLKACHSINMYLT